MDSGLSQLLSSLGLGRAPGLLPVRSVDRGAGGAQELDFAELLRQATAGRVRSERPVSAPSGAVTGQPLTADQLARLSEAADRAEAGGLTSALVLIDGRALTLDVGARRITGEVGLAAGQGASAATATLSGIDGVLAVPPAAGGAGSSSAGGASGAALVAPVSVGATVAAPSALGNPSLAALLESLAAQARRLEEPPAPGDWGAPARAAG